MTATRGVLYRCHLFSFAGPQTEGVISRWTKNLEPIGDREVRSGELVEMHVQVENDALHFDGSEQIRFDILEEDFLLTGGLDDGVLSYLGSGTLPEDPSFPVRQKTTRFERLQPGQSVLDALNAFRVANPSGFLDHILILAETGSDPVYHLIAWWQVEHQEDSSNAEFYFVVTAVDRFEDQSDAILDVSAERVAHGETGAGFYPAPELLRRTHGAIDNPGAAISESNAVQHLEASAPGGPRGRARPYRHVSPSPATPVAVDQPADPWPWPPPVGRAVDDRVEDGGTELDGQLVAIFPRRQAVKIRTGRHVVAYDLRRAIRWGVTLFGTRSFVIVQGPVDQPNSRYLVLSTDYALTAMVGNPNELIRVAGRSLHGVAVSYWQLVYTDREKHPYVLRALFAVDDDAVFPLNQRLIEAYFGEIERGNRADAASGMVDPDRLREAAFGKISSDTEVAADQLAELAAVAFRLLSPEQRLIHLRTLVDARTLEPQERAIIEIFKACEHPDELRDLVHLLEAKELYARMFDDLSSSSTWSLFVEIGKKFGGPPTLTLEGVRELLVASKLLEHTLSIEALSSGIVIAPQTLAELRYAAEAFWNTAVGTVDGLWMLVSEPDRLIEGVGQLIRLVVAVELAKPPILDAASIELLRSVVENMVKTSVYALNGIRLLDRYGTKNISEDVVGVIKWAIILEIASWFVGIGEVRAVIGALRIGDRAADLAHIFRVLRGGSKAANLERAASKFERLALLIGKRAAIEGEDTALRLISHLPDEDIRTLNQAASAAELGEVQDLATIATRHPDLIQEADKAIERMRMLATLEQRGGGVISDTVAQGFQRLASRPDFGNAELHETISVLPAENTGLFMRTVVEIPAAAFGDRAGIHTIDFFRQLAQRPRAMEFVLAHGYDTFSVLHRHAGANFDRLHEYMDALKVIQHHTLARGRDFEAVLTGIRAERPLAMLMLDDAQQAATLAAGLSHAEADLIYLAIIAENSTAFGKASERLKDRLQAVGTEPRRIAEIEEQIHRRNTTRRSKQVSILPVDIEAQRIAALDNEALFLDQVAGRALEMADGKSRAHVTRWYDRMHLDPALAEQEVKLLKAEVQASPELRLIAAQGGGPMLRRLWVHFRAPRPPGARLPKSKFPRYVEILVSRHYRGNHGEYQVAFRLSRDYIILKAPDMKGTIPGTDLTVIPRSGGPVLIIDNKALSGDELTRVGALTRNFPNNLGMDIDEFAHLADQADVPTHLRLALNRMRAAYAEVTPIVDKIRKRHTERGLSGTRLKAAVKKDIDTEKTQELLADILARHKIRRVVTDAGGEVTGLSDELTRMGVELEHLGLAPNPKLGEWTSATDGLLP